MRSILIILIGLFPVFASTQDTVGVKNYLETLTDSSFFGRGYVNKGCNIAADYLLNQFEEIGLNKPETGYLQNFTLSVNTFPVDLKLSLDSIPLRPGNDFIVNPRTGSSFGTFPIHSLDSTHFQTEGNPPGGDTIAVIDMGGIDTPNEQRYLFEFKQKTLSSKPIIQLEDKLTWSVGIQTNQYSEISILKNSYITDARSATLEITNKMETLDVANVIGFIEGNRADSIVVFTAHYDHLGMMGQALFPGASDNASGTAMLLDFTHYYSLKKPEFTTWFICFAGEEAGLAGSKYFVEHPVFDLNRVKILINLDLMGSASEGIALVNGKMYPEWIDLISEINRENNLVDRIKVRGQAANSDHYWFAEQGVPAIFIYTMGNIKAYHDVYDTPEVVDWAKYKEVFTLITEFVSAL